MRITDPSDSIRATIPPPRAAFLIRCRDYLALDSFRISLLLLVAIIIHMPALSGDLIWDDSYLAHDNPFIKSPLFVLEVFRHHLFLDSFSAHYRPVQNLSLIVDYFFWHDNTYGFHFTSILTHALSGVLLYFLAKRILAGLFAEKATESVIGIAAFLIAFLWTVHPVHSAAVDYISGRADSLAFFFAAGGWLLFLRAERTARMGFRILFYSLGAASTLLAMCSRETAALWLALFLLHTLFFVRRMTRRRKALVLCACLLLATAYYGLRQLPERRPGPGPNPGWSAPVRSVLVLRALGDYGRLLVFPANLHMERTIVNPGFYDSSASWRKSVSTEYLSIIGFTFAGLLALGCIWSGPGRRTRIFGTCWFTLGFLPISNLFDLNATVAEHWLYLPSVGFLLFLVGAGLDLPKRSRPVLAACGFVAVLALSLRSADRSSDWTTAEHFYERTMAAGGTSVRVSLNLGQLYAQRGDYPRAEKVFHEILANLPNYAIAQNNLANVLFQQGRKKEAEALFAAATAAAPNDRKEYPRTWLAAVNLASLRQQANDFPGALKILDQTRADYPEIWEIISTEAEMLRSAQKPVQARRLVSDFVSRHWWHYEASLALGQLYGAGGDVDKAVTILRQASRLDVHEVEALNLIAQMRIRQNRLDEACRTQRAAVSRQPDAPRQYILLSDILERMGHSAEAKDAIAEVARLKAIGSEASVLAN